MADFSTGCSAWRGTRRPTRSSGPTARSGAAPRHEPLTRWRAVQGGSRAGGAVRRRPRGPAPTASARPGPGAAGGPRRRRLAGGGSTPSSMPLGGQSPRRRWSAVRPAAAPGHGVSSPTPTSSRRSRGDNIPVTLKPPQRCGDCGGSGPAPAPSQRTCADRNGAGQVQLVRQSLLGPDGHQRNRAARRWHIDNVRHRARRAAARVAPLPSTPPGRRAAGVDTGRRCGCRVAPAAGRGGGAGDPTHPRGPSTTGCATE
jgi:hypothetical protein